MPKILWLPIILICIIAIVCIYLAYGDYSWSYLEAGQLAMLAITLIVLIAYAFSTNRIANATEQRWQEEQRPKLTRDVFVDSEARSEKVGFSLMNPTGYFIEATVRCNFKVYGESVDYPGAYGGTETWRCLPYRTATGVFRLDELLAKKGKTLEQMVSERNANNASQQLTMELETELKNEIGRTGVIPVRPYYFCFERWRWIPILTEPK